MKRPLVVTHEEARHPFRQGLPRHVFQTNSEGSETLRRTSHDDDDDDWKLFVLSFAAFFTVAYSFIA
jgi:hypothetical protein